MIPLGLFTDPAVPAAFLPPGDDDYDPLHMRCTGGIALNDGHLGRQVQNWSVTWADGTATVAPETEGTGTTVALDGVLAISLAFDSNMAYALAYQKADGARLLFFNGLHNAYETLFVAGALSCRCCVDDAAAFYSGRSDVMFGYVLAGNLCYRQQRDRFAIEYAAGALAKPGTLVGLGPSVSNRLQFKIDPNV